MKPRQLSLLKRDRTEHGGDTRKGKRKLARPFSPKCAIHVTLGSRRARGEWSMLRKRHRALIEDERARLARKYGVKLRDFANVGNHLHIVLQARTRESFQGFLRELSGTIAFRVMGARKGEKKGPFWDGLAHSKLIQWGRQYSILENYLFKNLLEADGWIRETLDTPPRRKAPPD